MHFTPKTLSVLEYDKITEALASMAPTEGAAARARSLSPSDDYDTVLLRQRRTEDAKRLINAKGYPTFSAAEGTVGAAERAYKGAVLSPKELIDIASLLYSARNLLDYIREHAAQRLSAGMMAQRCYYTIEHFSRKFKRFTSKTFTEYLTECRLDIAEELLSNTRKTVDTVISLSGFTSRGEFFKKFAERFGTTPLEYRNIKNRY